MQTSLKDRYLHILRGKPEKLRAYVKETRNSSAVKNSLSQLEFHQKLLRFVRSLEKNQIIQLLGELGDFDPEELQEADLQSLQAQLLNGKFKIE